MRRALSIVVIVGACGLVACGPKPGDTPPATPEVTPKTQPPTRNPDATPADKRPAPFAPK